MRTMNHPRKEYTLHNDIPLITPKIGGWLIGFTMGLPWVYHMKNGMIG